MRIQEAKKIFAVLLVIGFLIGIVYVNIFAKAYVASMGIFNDYFLSQYSGAELNTEEYILYIAKIRLIPVLLLLVTGCTDYKRTAASICLLWTGFSSGLILSASVLKMGIKGVLLCLTGIMPHFICYIAAYFMMLLYLFSYPDIRWNSSKTVSMILFLLLGIISECYVNPVLMDIFINAL